MSTLPRPDREAIRVACLALREVHAVVRHASAALAEGRDARGLVAPPDSAFERLESLGGRSGLADAIVPRARELRLERDALFGVGDARRRAARARYGHADESVVVDGVPTTIGDLADAFARADVVADDSDVVGAPTRLLATFAEAAGIDVRVRIEPSLVADAATGDRTLFLAPRVFRLRELVRLAAHEITGHLTAAANARMQPLELLRVGTAGSWEDQEGLALALEHEAGVLDGVRLRRLGARALAALVYLGGGEAQDAAARLSQLGLPPDVVALAVRRAFRAGGSARDLAYLRGYARVRTALAEGTVGVDELRIGRVSVDSLAILAPLRSHGLVRPPAHRPSLADSLRATFTGTSFATSPPRRAASFTRFDDT